MISIKLIESKVQKLTTKVHFFKKNITIKNKNIKYTFT